MILFDRDELIESRSIFKCPGGIFTLIEVNCDKKK